MNENSERHMKFILEQQAKFAENLATQQERLDAFAQQQAGASAKHEERLDAFAQQQAEASAKHEERLNAFAQQQAEASAKHEERLNAFAQQQAEAWAKQEERDAAWRKQMAEVSAEVREWHAQAMARSNALDRKIDELVEFTGILRDALIGLTHHAERHDREMADLVARGKETDARLNALILIVERHISDHQ
jgi:hypothetical protein